MKPMIDSFTFRKIFSVLHHLSHHELEEAGVIDSGAKGRTCWKRFNSNLTLFVLKLDQDKLENLTALVRRYT